MNKLEQARLKINEADQQLKEAFEKRFLAIQEVLAYKKENNLPIFDASREANILENANNQFDDPLLQKKYIELLQYILKISKEYQEELLDK